MRKSDWKRKKANVKHKRQIQNATRNLKCNKPTFNIQHSLKVKEEEEKKLLPFFFSSFIHYLTLRPFYLSNGLPFLSLFCTSSRRCLSFNRVQIYCLRLPVSSFAFALNMCLIIMICASNEATQNRQRATFFAWMPFHVHSV